MKKVVIIFLSLLIAKNSFAQDAGRGMIYGKENETTHFEHYQLQNVADKRMARIYGIPGIVLCGSGMATMLFAGLFVNGTNERDPERFSKIQNDRNKLFILGGSLIAVSVPLFVLSRHHYNKYKNAIVLNFQSEPVHGFRGQQLQIASIGLNIGL